MMHARLNSLSPEEFCGVGETAEQKGIHHAEQAVCDLDMFLRDASFPLAIEGEAFGDPLKACRAILEDHPEPQIPVFDEDLTESSNGEESRSKDRACGWKDRRAISYGGP